MSCSMRPTDLLKMSQTSSVSYLLRDDFCSYIHDLTFFFDKL